jgi:hypothetical protein
MLLSFNDECAASDALLRWLESQQLDPHQALFVLAQTMARLVASTSVGSHKLTALDCQMLDSVGALMRAYAQSFLSKIHQ